jgi:hypothetical protein
MQTFDLPRHQLIKRIATQSHENGAALAACLWTQLAAPLSLVIGAGGFESLYGRSVHLSQVTYPWLSASTESPAPDPLFHQLQKSLQQQPPALASEANCLLLVTFTNILGSMIGESLTSRILSSAWNVDSLAPSLAEPMRESS